MTGQIAAAAAAAALVLAAPAAILLESGAALTDLHGHPIFPFDLADYAGAKVPFLAQSEEVLDER